MIEDDLDDIIKKKLQEHEEDYDANSWSGLMEKMDQIDFDESIKRKLTNHQENYDHASWTQLSSRMDEINVSGEVSKVKGIKEQLLAHRETVMESHWQILKAELEALEQRRYRLWGTKAIEAVTILLLLWTFINFGPIFNSEQINSASSIQLDYAIDPAYETEDYWTEYEEVSSFDVIQTAPKAEQAFNNLVDDAYVGTSAINRTRAGLRRRADLDQNTRSNDQFESEFITTINQLDQAILDRSSDKIQLVEVSTSALFTSTNSDLSLLKLGLIQPLDIVLTHDHPTSDLYLIEQSEDKSYLNKNDGLWFSINYSADINLINSGFNLGFARSQLSSGLLGHTGGLSLSWQKGIVEIQSGFRLSQKAHSPKLLRSFTQASDFSVLEHNLELIEFTQAQIPITVKFHALNASKSHIYGFVGVTGNTILDYDFTVEKTVQPSTRVRPTDFNAIVDLTDLPAGFSEGGSFRYNTNFTGVIGFGVESSIADKISYYVQPQYQHQFGGELNNYVSRIGTISVETGVKLKF